jgi:hypothetical protein
MSFKSQAQKDKLAQLVKEGKVSQETYDKMESATTASLPKRLTPEKPKKIKTLDDLREVAKKKLGRA